MRSEYAPWITDTIKRSIYHRDLLRKKAVKTGSENVNKTYKRARNDLNKLIKNTKANYFMNALNNTKKNSKEMWKMVNKLTNKQSKTTNITKVITDDRIIEEPQVITNKTGSKLQCNNYRPISMLSAVAKVFQKLISNQLYIYMETSGILTQQQAGFRQNQSTETSLLNITNK